MENQFESGQEKIPTKEEVMEIINKQVESPEKFTTLREISDEKGISLLDLRIEGKNSGEIIEYLYTRAGTLPNGVPTAQTSIEVSYYQDGNIIGGERIAIYNSERAEWDGK
jgi:hypothetical protein